MANTTSENAPQKSFSRAERKSVAVRCRVVLESATTPGAQHKRHIPVSACDRQHTVDAALQKVALPLVVQRRVHTEPRK